MANLGTLDQMRYPATQTVASAMIPGIARNGSTADKWGLLLGAYLGDRMAQRRKNKENAKLDMIEKQASNTDIPDTDSVISNKPISQAEYDYIVNGTLPVNAIGNTGTISEAPSSEYANILQDTVGNTSPKTNKIPFNPNYNMDYMEKEARRQGISSNVWNSRKEGLQRNVAQNAEAFYLPQIQQKLYGKDANTDSIIEGMGMLNELSKYSPDAAKAYQALAVGGLQGNQKFEQQKELAQINANLRKEMEQIKANNQAARDIQRLQNRIDYRNLTAGLGNGKNGYDPTKVNNAIKGIQEIEQIVADGGTLTPAMRQAYNMHRQYLDSLGGTSTTTQNNGATTQTTTVQSQQQETQKQSAASNVRNIFDSIDFSNYDDDKLASGKKYNFANGTQAVVDAMRNAGANDDQIFKAVDSMLAKKEAAGELPEGYRESFAHSMGRKTAKELNDEAIAAQERKARELDMQLHPEKYNIDPFDGIKYFADAVANGKPLWNLAGNYNK